MFHIGKAITFVALSDVHPVFVNGALAHTDAVINNDDTAVRKSNANIVRLCIVSIFNKLKYRRFFIGKVLDTQKFSYCAIFHNIFKSFHKESLHSLHSLSLYHMRK